MKREILLVANGDAASNATIAEAVKQSGHRLRKISSCRQAFEILAAGLDDVDAVIIDLDPGVHSMAVLEAIGSSAAAPPVIAITGLEETEVAPIAFSRGSIDCIGKPFSLRRLLAVINLVSQPDWRSEHACSCDLWGHPRLSRKRPINFLLN